MNFLTGTPLLFIGVEGVGHSPPEALRPPQPSLTNQAHKKVTIADQDTLIIATIYSFVHAVDCNQD